MTTVVGFSGNIIEISWTGALTDFDFETDMPAKFVSKGFVNVESIQFIASGADTFVLREGGLTGPICMFSKLAAASDYEDKPFHGVPLKPYIEADNQTFVVFANVKVIMVLSANQSINQ